VRLGGGLASNYSLYFYGQQKSSMQNIDLLGGDSLYILVQLSIDTKQADLPYLVQDSILFTTNGNLQKVRLIAWGQDANYFKQDSITSNTTWTAGKSYVIFDKLKVTSNATLTIEPGTNVVFGNGASLEIAGLLKAQGTFEKPITFAGYRQEAKFAESAGQWNSIILHENSNPQLLSWCKIKNGTTGIKLIGTGGSTKATLEMDHCKVYNMGNACLSFEKASATLSNSLFYNAANNLLIARGGGDYKSYNCTFTNSNSDFLVQSPCVSMVSADGDILWSATFINNIIWGNQTDELVIKLPTGIIPVVTNNLIKAKSQEFAGNSNLLSTKSTYVAFDNSTDKDNYNLSAESPAVNAGIIITGYTDQLDLNNISRDTQPDMGAMEYKP
jgi:hypothetical protein